MPSLIYARADEPAPATEPTDAPIMSLREALKKAQPGTLVQLLPGRFTTKIKVRDLHGREDAPIVIKGSLRETVIDGLADPLNVVEERAETWAWNSRAVRELHDFGERSRPVFRVKRSSWIEWRDLWVMNCWPNFLTFTSCHHLIIAGCRMLGGKYLIYGNDTGSKQPSHHILLEDNHWSQDPTGPDDPSSPDPSARKIWQDWTWHEMKKPPRTDEFPDWEDLRFMNGAFFGSTDIAGSVIIRRNQLRFAFNAIRMEVYEDQDRREPLRPDDQGNAPDMTGNEFNYTPPDLTRNTNVEIYDNVIEYIRDNAIEPEYGSTNWWVWNNRITNVHKAFSVHNNGGGFWYYFGNVGSTDAVPPAQLNEPEEWRDAGDPPRKLGGGFFKLFFGPPLPTKPCFAFHNSWRPRGGIVNHGELRHFTHLNNAVEHCAPVDPGTDLHCSENPVFASPFDAAQKPFNYNFATEIPPTDNDARNRYDSDVSTGADFPVCPRKQGQEMAGVEAADDVFDPRRRADYKLASDSPARGAVQQFTIRGRVDWPADEDWTSSASDAGAIQPHGRFEGPAFAHLENRWYEEAPRLVALEALPLGVGLVFSVPLEQPNPVPNPSEFVLSLRDGTDMVAAGIDICSRRILLTLESRISANSVVQIRLPAGLAGGLNAKSLPLTAWGAIVPIAFSADRSKI